MRHRALLWYAFVCLGLLAGPGMAWAAFTAPPLSEWQAFTSRYLGADGRVIDTANAGISHSEGQGYGMFFAAHFGDRRRFELIWEWTRANLSRSEDSLFMWRFDPHHRFPPDSNNATDGDLYIAWALLRAAERWEVPEYRARATRMGRDLLRCCVVESQGRRLLLPGAAGFRESEGVIVNLSYYAFGAIRALSRAVPDPDWAALERDALALMRQAEFGRWRLPPDWLFLPASPGSGPTLAVGRPTRFSWDAIRIALNLAWTHPEEPTLDAARRFWSDPAFNGRIPAWVDLRSDRVAPYTAHAGVQAIYGLARARAGDGSVAPPLVADAPDYYGAALILQARIAAATPPEAPAFIPLPLPPPAPPPERRAFGIGLPVIPWRLRPLPTEPAEPNWARPAFLVPGGPRATPPELVDRSRR
ncbi:glycosyl hydrolase family 8 [Sediminicoccus sp. KRV36]|uniref:glycosyl hydrolase family 8 n=1 Tax=Sediminicoccus sp. KRV36 TaxID=3133721 RepID=UPI00200C3DF0|nr:glycosyl hydrolase family 8 [Sediminicoccus rosea]UPY38606.1 glycosyl hydrolase family 5 [Sediminicoccus rosea]